MRTVAKNGIWRVKVEKSEQRLLIKAEALLTMLGDLTGDADVFETARRLHSAIVRSCGDFGELAPAGKEPTP